MLKGTKADPSRMGLCEILRVVADAAKAFAEIEDLPNLVDAVADRLAASVRDACAVHLIPEDGGSLAAATGASLLEEHPEIRRVIETRTRLIVSRDDDDVLGIELLKLCGDRCEVQPHSLLITPLHLRGRALGVIVVTRFRSDSPSFDERDADLTQTLADLAALAIGRVQEFAALRKESARALKSRFARLEQVGILGVLVTDSKNRVLEVNETVLGIVGYSREEVLAADFQWATLTAPESADVDAKAIRDLATTGAAGLREKICIRKDGSRVWVMAATAQIEDGGTISFILDLTERKRGEAALRAANERKAADEARFRLAAIVESSADAIIGKTLDGIITSWNGGAQRLFGYAAEEAIGKSVSILLPKNKEEEEAQILARLRRGGVDHFDTVRIRKDGREVSVSVTSSPVYDSHGNLVGASKVARDITDRKAAERTLAEAKTTAENAVRELEAFSYSVAHDLRAPLRGMNGFARVLLESYADKLDDQGKDCLQEILLNATRMGNLIDALLSLAQVTRTLVTREDVDLSAMVLGILNGIVDAEPERRVEIVVEGSLHADVDRALTQSLLDNLVRNAWKFTSKSAVARIEFGATDDHDTRAFFVRDNGAGFDMELAGKLFAPFQRLHKAADYPGTGIGLANAQRIVQRHGGRIWAEGSIDHGATFYFTLPTVSAGADMT